MYSIFVSNPARNMNSKVISGLDETIYFMSIMLIADAVQKKRTEFSFLYRTALFMRIKIIINIINGPIK